MYTIEKRLSWVCLSVLCLMKKRMKRSKIIIMYKIPQNTENRTAPASIGQDDG